MKRSMVGGRLLTGAIHRRCLVLLPSLSLAMVLPGIAMVLPWYCHGIALYPSPASLVFPGVTWDPQPRPDVIRMSPRV